MKGESEAEPQSDFCTLCQAARRRVPDSPVRGEEMEEIKHGFVRGTFETGNGEAPADRIARGAPFSQEAHTMVKTPHC